MNDVQLMTLLRAQLIAGLTRHGQSSVPVIGSYQPTSQGRQSTPAIYFYRVQDYRYGWQSRKRVYDQPNNLITSTESQWMESTFQIYALAEYDPKNLALPNANDLTNLAAMICNSDSFVSGMRAGGAGVQRVTTIRNPFFVNDQGQFEPNPSFDITISHKREIVEQIPVAEEVDLTIYRV